MHCLERFNYYILYMYGYILCLQVRKPEQAPNHSKAEGSFRLLSLHRYCGHGYDCCNTFEKEIISRIFDHFTLMQEIVLWCFAIQHNDCVDVSITVAGKYP